MPSRKDRLYIALYARGGRPTMPGLEDTYHWAFLVGPKEESSKSVGSRFHVKENLAAGDESAVQLLWRYEEQAIPMAPTAMLLVRVVIAKVKSPSRLRAVFESTPLRPEQDGWNCVEWARDAFSRAVRDGKALGTCVRDWIQVRDAAMEYIEGKKVAGRFRHGDVYDSTRAPTWDLLERMELAP